MSKKEPRYTLSAFYDGYDPEGKDIQIERAAKRSSDGAGFGFGERDLGFSFSHRRSAIDAAARIKKIKGVRVELFDEKDEKEIPV